MNNRMNEIRSFAFEVNANENAEHGHFLEGRPIVYNQTVQLWNFSETIAPGALDNADLRDVRFLVNHNSDGIPLARSRNNNVNSSMQLMPDAEGMRIRVDLDVENNAEAKALYSAVQRGDITGMSFRFSVAKDAWADVDTENPKRTILEIGSVSEVSAVTWPAYDGTSIEARGQQEALDSATAALESARAKGRECRNEAARLRILAAVKEEERADE